MTKDFKRKMAAGWCDDVLATAPKLRALADLVEAVMPDERRRMAGAIQATPEETDRLLDLAEAAAEVFGADTPLYNLVAGAMQLPQWQDRREARKLKAAADPANLRKLFGRRPEVPPCPQ
jgi:nucleoside-diphosphate-sugar epimerase